MLSVSNLSIHFGGRYLFDNVTFNVKPSDRIGLIGRNGSGKTTLLRILYSLVQPEEGVISKPNDYTLGYLPQESKFNSEKSVFEETASALIELRSSEKLMHEISEQLSARRDYESAEYTKLTHTLVEVTDRFNYLGGASIEAEIEKILIGLGFLREEFDKPSSQFSGGWQMRIELAKILLRKPDCILLDEPTNHLDIESIAWLEQFLKYYSGSVIIVSHDKRFLNFVTNRTIEISLGKIYDMPLPYSRFIEERSIQREQLMAQQKNQQRQIAQTERFIERFRSKATLATRVQSRIKQLDKIERIEIEEEDVSSLRFKFPEAPRSGIVVVDVKKLTKRFGAKLVLNNIDLVIERGEKVAFVGKNGEGKTTLSKILAGVEPYEGNLTIGYNVQTGYFEQHEAQKLDGDSTVFDIIDNAATGDMRTRVRSLLGAFLFSGETVYKKAKVLSGGEKSRLALAKMLLQPFNLLILDEPTNHLDIPAKEVLKHALNEYQGALVLVSHDREFLSGLTTKTIEFRNKGIREYSGDINDFLETKQLETLKQLETSAKTATNNNEEKIDSAGTAKQQREQRKQVQREQNRISRLIANCEDEIEKLEIRIAEIEDMFASPDYYDNPEKMQSVQVDYDSLRKSLGIKMSEWEKLGEELESVNENAEKE